MIALDSSPSEIELKSPLHSVRLKGVFAESLSTILSSQPSNTDKQRLAALAQQHSWLHGLEKASPHPPHGLLPTLLGKSLGMLFVELTSRCNERCIHCYAESSPEENDFLSSEEVCRTLDVCRTLGRPFVQFTGGDPLIHRDLLKIVAHAHALDFAGIEIYTNGLLLTDKLLAALAPYKPRLSFSIYADSAEVHDAITRLPGSWLRTLEAMQRALKAGFEIRAGIVLMPENLECAERMHAFLDRRLGLAASSIHFDAVNRVGRGQLMSLAEKIEIVPSHAPSSGPERAGKLCLAANGDLYPCIFARHLQLGNIRTQSLQEILADLDRRKPASPSAERWNLCSDRLSCGDCRIVAYTIGNRG